MSDFSSRNEILNKFASNMSASSTCAVEQPATPIKSTPASPVKTTPIKFISTIGSKNSGPDDQHNNFNYPDSANSSQLATPTKILTSTMRSRIGMPRMIQSGRNSPSTAQMISSNSNPTSPLHRRLQQLKMESSTMDNSCQQNKTSNAKTKTTEILKLHILKGGDELKSPKEFLP